MYRKNMFNINIILCYYINFFVINLRERHSDHPFPTKVAKTQIDAQRLKLCLKKIV